MNKNIYLITGGTGSVGIEVLKKLLEQNDFTEIRIFSRDDKKHIKMRQAYTDQRITYHIGDVKDLGSLQPVMKGVDYVFHAAALKLVPSCESNPLESIKVNILGSYNVLQCAIDNQVKKVIMLSTDKTVYPVSAMGASKLLMERMILDTLKTANKTEVVITRFGNIVNSTGSVIENFLQKIDNDTDLVVTGKEMTRFMMKPEDAVDLIWHAFEKGIHGSIYVSKMLSFSIDKIAQAFIKLSNSPLKIIYQEPRFAEKYSERIVSEEEEAYLIDEGDFYRISTMKTIPIKTYDSFHNILTLEETIDYFRYLFRGVIIPKVGGKNIDQCVSLCMDDPATIEEYPDTAERKKVCYAACSNRFMEAERYRLSLVTVRNGQYVFTGEFEGENPTIRLIRGETYVFDIETYNIAYHVKFTGHPFWIKTIDSTGVENAYSAGVSNNGIQEGIIIFNVPKDAPNQLFYNCQFHETMKGTINIVDPDIEDL